MTSKSLQEVYDEIGDLALTGLENIAKLSIYSDEDLVDRIFEFYKETSIPLSEIRELAVPKKIIDRFEEKYKDELMMSEALE